MPDGNLFDHLPVRLEAECFQDLVKSDTVRIERILSHGQSSPESGWYDQDEHEWVMVLQGRGRVEFEGGAITELGPGDHLNLPAHQKHRVAWTDPDQITVWLAVFYR